jgi:hypothetical protein
MWLSVSGQLDVRHLRIVGFSGWYVALVLYVEQPSAVWDKEDGGLSVFRCTMSVSVV